MNFKSCLYYLGLSFFPLSIMSLINIFYSLYFNNLINIKSYLIVLLVSLIIGSLFYLIGKKFRESINIYEQFFLIFLIYFFISIFISIPFYLSNYNLSLINSFFEATSGFTGTGFSILNTISDFDEPLTLWRSSSQWLGGLYFLVFLILIFSNKQVNFKMLDLTFNLEKKINFSSNLLIVSNRIFLIYLSLTIVIFFLFVISGLRIFDSLNLTMSLISSGGFLPVENLSEIILNNFQLIIFCIGLAVPILNFYFFYNLILNRENIKFHLEDLYLVMVIFSFFAIFYFINDLDLLFVMINVLSSLGNSGISIGTIPENFGLYFLILTMIGGSVLSVTSGLKLMRIYILLKAFLIEIYRLVKPNVILNTKIMFSAYKINNENIKVSFLIFILFFFSLFILSSVLLFDILNFENSFKLSILTLTNTNVSNIFGMQEIQFQDLFIFSKISLIIFMIIAKVELLTIFILIRKFFLKD